MVLAAGRRRDRIRCRSVPAAGRVGGDVEPGERRGWPCAGVAVAPASLSRLLLASSIAQSPPAPTTRSSTSGSEHDADPLAAGSRIACSWWCSSSAIGVPLAGTVASVDAEDTTEENREAAAMPASPRDLPALAAWPDAFTKYFADHCAFRSRLVRWQARVRVGLLETSPAPGVMLGDQGWLFYANDGAVQDYTGVQPFWRRSSSNGDRRCSTRRTG